MIEKDIRNVPITFILGFYVSSVVKRWWEQLLLLPWPEDVLTYTLMILPKKDEESSRKRRCIVRWLNLTAALAFRDLSVTVRKRFPRLNDLVESGLMTYEEYQQYVTTEARPVKWFLPTQWIQTLVRDHVETAEETKTCSTSAVTNFMRELNFYRSSLRRLYCYDWVCIPLVYTQVTSIATYGFFGLCLLGRQYLASSDKINESDHIDVWFPFFTVLQFVFYIGWFKVAQALMRPFESDEDDFELSYLLNRHIETSYSLIEETFKRDLPAFHQDADVNKETIPEHEFVITEDNAYGKNCWEKCSKSGIRQLMHDEMVKDLMSQREQDLKKLRPF